MSLKSDVTFGQTIEEFIQSKFQNSKDCKIENGSISNIVYKGKKLKKLDLDKVFENIKSEYLTEKITELEPNEIRLNIMESIQNKTSKDRAYYVYSEYINYMNDKYFKDKPKQQQIEELPSYYSELERRLLIAKKMHSEFNINDIAREFLVSERTIEKDLEVLNNGEVKVLNQKLKVKYEKRNGERIELKSKAHPLFLVENLTQVVAMLNGLLYVAKRDYGYSQYAKETAVSIWMQLSDDAKDRIQNVLVKDLSLDEEWYDEISKLSEREINKSMFKIEEQFLENRHLDILKNGKPCHIEYIDDDGNIVNQYVDRIRLGKGDTIIGIIYGKENIEMKINKNRIICYVPQVRNRKNK